MVYKPEMDKRAQRPKEQAQQGKDITRIADGQEQSTKSIAKLLGQQKIANENLETGFNALQKSQKTSFIRRNMDNAFEILATRGEGKRAHKQREGYQKEHLKDDKKDRGEFKTSDKKTDLDYDIQRHQEDTGEDQLTVLGKIADNQKIEVLSLTSLAKAQQNKNNPQWKFLIGWEKDKDKIAKKLEKDKDKIAKKLRAHNIGLRVFAKTRVRMADRAGKTIAKQQIRLDEMKKELESVGKTATDSFRYRRAERKQIRRERLQAMASGSKDAEKKAKDRMREARSQTTLFRMAKGIGKMVGFMGKAAKTVAGKLPSIGKLLMMGVVGALLLFMNSPAMAKAEKFILETLIPKFGTWYDEKFKPMFDKFLKFIEETTIPEIWVGIEQSLVNMEPIFKDIGNIVKELGEGGLLKAFKHTLSLVKNIMILFIDGIGNILKSLGLVDFKGPSATEAMKKGWAPTIEDIKKNLPWYLKLLFPEQADRKAKIRMLESDIEAYEDMKRQSMFGPGDVQPLKDLREKLKELKGGKPVSTIAPIIAPAKARRPSAYEVKSTAAQLAAQIKRAEREAMLARYSTDLFGMGVGPTINQDNSVKSVVSKTSNNSWLDTPLTNMGLVGRIVEGSF